MEVEAMETLKQNLVDFFVEMMDYRQFFKRKLYEEAFMKCYEEHKDLMAAIIETCEKAQDKEYVLDELSGVIPDYVHEQINGQKGKSKKEGLMIDYNMTMVTFVIPVIGYSNNESCNSLIDRMVEKWNMPPVTMKIRKSDFETLKGGFKSRLCYITTAVCASQHKADDCYELTLLREYRDGYLLSQQEGRKVVEQYYDVAPTIVNRINKQKNASEIYEEIYRGWLSRCIDLIEENRLEECREVYADMVERLKKKYVFS